MSVHSAAETMRGMERLGPVVIAALLAFGVAFGAMVWPTTSTDMVRLIIPSE